MFELKSKKVEIDIPRVYIPRPWAGEQAWGKKLDSDTLILSTSHPLTSGFIFFPRLSPINFTN